MQKNFRDPLVSIIINCHNGEKFLRKSILSVLNQTYTKWEIIFLDNFSTDNSKKIFKSFKDKRLKYFKSKNFLKLYEGRNVAINKSNGQLICFLDSDDWWDKKKLFKQVNYFKKNPKIKMVYSNYYLYFQKTKQKKKFSKNYLPEGMITQQLLNNYCIGILTVMIKKDIFRSNLFNQNYNIIGDFDFFLKISKFIHIKCIQLPLAYYRLHNSNYSTNKFNEYIKEISTWLILNKKSYANYSLKKIKILKIKLKLKKLLKDLNNFTHFKINF